MILGAFLSGPSLYKIITVIIHLLFFFEMTDASILIFIESENRNRNYSYHFTSQLFYPSYENNIITPHFLFLYAQLYQIINIYYEFACLLIVNATF
jgi:hypothetical protein